MRRLLLAVLVVPPSSVALAQDFTQPPNPVQSAVVSVTFPVATKIAFMDPERVLAASAEGKRLGRCSGSKKPDDEGLWSVCETRTIYRRFARRLWTRSVRPHRRHDP